ncbi:hypothetical protein [Lactobacillus sp.]|uniref:hypothetical protein n=1 Tax=Lactobacillus sp. TaxID=1591 RepID=UPI0019BEF77B|nr:hypothetical protein [Lactobacillus sp.]MBD5429649.1 hypothetical protein [Lactobacillus sp.]
MSKKLILFSGLVLLSLGATACQNKNQVSPSRSSQTSTSTSEKQSSLTKESSSSTSEENSSSTATEDEQSSSQEVTTSTNQNSTSSSQSSSSNESSTSTKNDQSQDTSKESKTNLPGDEGLFQIPSEYQGTWYGYDSEGKKEEITFEGSKIITEYGSTELHKVNIDKLPTIPSEKQVVAAKDYGRALFINSNGIKYINVRGYFQGAGDGSYYGYHTEKGQPVIIGAYGAGLYTSSVYWKSPELAKQYKDEKFADLNYQN